MAEFAGDQCPARGVNLTHTFDKDNGKCRHCGQSLTFEKSYADQTHRDHEWREAGLPALPVSDHLYVHTITGQCARSGCARPSDAHPTVLAAPDPMTECDIDHASLTPKLLIGDGGWQWSQCPRCNVQVEPKLPPDAVSHYGRRRQGIGTGDLSLRQRLRLQAWVGWLAFNGGDA